jgi:hypothetical protein
MGIDLPISVNISARQLYHPRFTDRLNELLLNYDTEIINRLEIETLETAVLEDINVVAEAIRKCRALGIHIAIDDFGTGYSSLAHLKHLRVDALKIDKSFICGMLHNPEDLAIVSGVIALANSFRYKVIAEGVESIDHILMLIELGCNLMQGYGIAHPMPADRIPAWLKSFAPDPLWQLAFEQRPTRDYFELLLAETNHRHWINQLLTSLDTSPELLHDHQRCRLSHWYRGEGERQYGNEDCFKSIEPLHQRIHQCAAGLYQQKRDGTPVEDLEAELSRLQDEFEHLLSNFRSIISQKYNDPTASNGATL